MESKIISFILDGWTKKDASFFQVVTMFFSLFGVFCLFLMIIYGWMLLL